MEGRESRLLRRTHLDYNRSGAHKFLQVMVRSEWWPGISADCQTHVRMCLICECFGRAHSHSDLHPLIIDAPMQVVSIDFIGPLDVAQHGFRYICSLVDAHTRYVEIVLTRSCDVATAIRLIKDFWISQCGELQILLADVATTLNSHRWLTFCQATTIRSIQVAPYLQLANGTNERLTQTILNLILHYLLAHVVLCGHSGLIAFREW